MRRGKGVIFKGWGVEHVSYCYSADSSIAAVVVVSAIFSSSRS
jgi:hypothetical protein